MTYCYITAPYRGSLLQCLARCVSVCHEDLDGPWDTICVTVGSATNEYPSYCYGNQETPSLSNGIRVVPFLPSNSLQIVIGEVDCDVITE